MKLTEEILEKNLPSGSGFDCDWTIIETPDSFRCGTAFHPMTEHGYYDGYADFSIIIKKNNPTDFRLMFHGNDSQYLNKKHMLRDYIEDTIYYSLSEILKGV